MTPTQRKLAIAGGILAVMAVVGIAMEGLPPEAGPDIGETTMLADTSGTPAPKGGNGEITVHRVYAEYDYGNAVVGYENDTGRTMRRAVTIRCNAIGPSGVIGTNTRSFFVHELGPLPPGYRNTVTVPVNLHGARLSSMECWVERAN